VNRKEGETVDKKLYKYSANPGGRAWQTATNYHHRSGDRQEAGERLWQIKLAKPKLQ
jgi:hypothetical protein